jgi:long-subunit acyl-CoA synthetase (AMP-forming)
MRRTISRRLGHAARRLIAKLAGRKYGLDVRHGWGMTETVAVATHEHV